MTPAGVFTLTSDAASLLLALIFSIGIFSFGLVRSSSSSVKTSSCLPVLLQGSQNQPGSHFL